MNYIFVTGGVVSSLGKGITAASIGAILKREGIPITFIKLDPYINVDPGTMSPDQHGEVFVTADGSETDLDLGHYERFTGIQLTKKSNVTTGQIYKEVIEKERAGRYLGSTVQVVPHVTDHIISKIKGVADIKTRIVIVEIGGTIGDIESLPFVEAARQMRCELGKDKTMFIHVTLIPFIKSAGEIKTKPTQHSVKELNKHGINPDMLICRIEDSSLFTEDVRKKISLFTNVDKSSVVVCGDVKSVYNIPHILTRSSNIQEILFNHFGFDRHKELKVYPQYPKRVPESEFSWKRSTILIVGKYRNFNESYKSLIESLRISANHVKHRLTIIYKSADDFLIDDFDFKNCDGILIPGGFGYRGIEGMIAVAKIAREKKIPFLGICLGMQVAIIEYFRNVIKLEYANSTEFDPDTPHPVIATLSQCKNVADLGGTMRLGAQEIITYPMTKIKSIYSSKFSERHRHRYEFNASYGNYLNNKDTLMISAIEMESRLAEAVELPESIHPFYVAVQFHPEFTTTVDKPHPLFSAFLMQASKSQ